MSYLLPHYNHICNSNYKPANAIEAFVQRYCPVHQLREPSAEHWMDALVLAMQAAAKLGRDELDWQGDVAAFNKAMGIPVASRPSVPTDAIHHRCSNLVEEEFGELMGALGMVLKPDNVASMEPAWVREKPADLVAIAKEVADLIYVLLGLSLSFGIRIEPVWDEIQRANMAKIDPETGAVIRRDDGKVMKPKGWTPPDVEGVLARQSGRKSE